MTNKEAIEILQREDSVCIETDEALEAYELAIEALKVVEIMQREAHPLMKVAYAKGKEVGRREAEEERPKGEWIIDGHHIRCNRCNEYICNTDREGNEIPDNFCPNCGADMREKDNDTRGIEK